MEIVDGILNVAGLLLWLNWRSIRFDPLARRLPSTLTGTLRPASTSSLRRWHFIAFILALLVLRALLYRWLGAATGSTTSYLDFGVTAQGFRHDVFLQTLAFSGFSFVRALGILYIALLFFSLLSGPQPIAGLIKIPLGRVNDWPAWARVILPFAATALFWWLAAWIFARFPPRLPLPPAQQFQHALVVGLSSYLVWKIPAAALLSLHVLSCYIYFGKHPVWQYVDATARQLLRPLSGLPLRAGRVDLAPLAALALLFLIFAAAGRALAWLYAHRFF